MKKVISPNLVHYLKIRVLSIDPDLWDHLDQQRRNREHKPSRQSSSRKGNNNSRKNKKPNNNNNEGGSSFWNFVFWVIAIAVILYFIGKE